MCFVSENKNSLNESIIQKKTNFTKDLDTYHRHTLISNECSANFCQALAPNP